LDQEEILDHVPELPSRVDFDDWEKDWGLVNLLSEKKNAKPWLPAGFQTNNNNAISIGTNQVFSISTNVAATSTITGTLVSAGGFGAAGLNAACRNCASGFRQRRVLRQLTERRS
jgi:hypothetical protein